jgi:hypothetical protein
MPVLLLLLNQENLAAALRPLSIALLQLSNNARYEETEFELLAARVTTSKQAHVIPTTRLLIISKHHHKTYYTLECCINFVFSSF